MSDVSADVLAEGWVVPEDIAALSVFSFARCFGFILQCELVSAFVESFLVRRGDLRLIDEEYTFTITQRLPATAY